MKQNKNLSHIRLWHRKGHPDFLNSQSDLLTEQNSGPVKKFYDQLNKILIDIQ